MPVTGELLACLAVIALVFTLINRGDDEAQYRMAKEDATDGPDPLYRVIEFLIILGIVIGTMAVVFGGVITIIH